MIEQLLKLANSPNLCFIKHKFFNARTVNNDLKILREDYFVRVFVADTTKGIGCFWGLLKQFIYFYWYGLILDTFDIYYIWFADYHSVIPVMVSKILGRKCIINIGGYDAEEILNGKPKSIKEYIRKRCVKYSINNATELFAVSDYIKNLINLPNCKTIYCCV